jgi:hypothetical protein
MLIIEGTSAHSWENGKWVIHCPNGRNFMVNELTYRLYNVLINAPTYEVASADFNAEFKSQVNVTQFKDYVSQIIGGYNILQEGFDVKRPSVLNNYLKLKVQLLNANVAGFIAQPLSHFYSPKYFWKVLISLVAFLACMFYAVPLKIAVDPAIISPASLALLPVLFYANMPIHEFGHIAACRNSGLKHGGVGFGFYFIMPVMYADITNIWLANKERRIIANMGGIFSELLYASVLVIIYLLTQNPVFYIAGLSIALFVVFELNPFVRFDGYWVLSDLTNTPNLLQKSKTVLTKTFNNLWHKQTKPFNIKEVWLLLYGTINTALLFLFMGYMAYSHRIEIAAFPATIYGIISNWLNQNWDISQINRQLLIVLTFYVLVFRLSSQYLIKAFRSWRKRATPETTG